MPHPLLIGPAARLEARFSLPLPQQPTAAIAGNLRSSMMTTDALRRAGTSRSGISTGPLAPVQNFVHEVDPTQGGPNAPANLASGLLKANARRLATKTRGQSAGI